MPLTSRAFFPGIVPVRLNPAGVAGAAVDPAAVGFAEEEGRADVVAWMAGGGWRVGFDGWVDEGGGGFAFAVAGEADDGVEEVGEFFVGGEVGEVAFGVGCYRIFFDDGVGGEDLACAWGCHGAGLSGCFGVED